MRHSYQSHQELAHVWAQNKQPTTWRATSGNMLFVGPRIYSWGTHFCIARILPSGVVVYGTHKYSSSTGKHQSIVRGAVSHRKVVYCYDPDGTAADNVRQAHRDVAAALLEGENKRRREHTRAAYKAQALQLAQQANEYLAALPDDEKVGVKPIDLSTLDHIRDEAMRADELARAAAEAHRLKVLEVERAKLAAWRAHEYDGFMGQITALRLSKDGTEVETSRGATIPVSHAKKLWPLIENCRKVGKGLEDRNVRLGHFTLTRIGGDGSIVVGCHNIAYSEIEAIARQLGLITEGETA